MGTVLSNSAQKKIYQQTETQTPHAAQALRPNEAASKIKFKTKSEGLVQASYTAGNSALDSRYSRNVFAHSSDALSTLTVRQADRSTDPDAKVLRQHKPDRPQRTLKSASWSDRASITLFGVRPNSQPSPSQVQGKYTVLARV